MIVVLEGPDGCGKTTVANALERLIGQSVVVRMSSGPPGDDPFEECMAKLRNAEALLKTGWSAVVIDRLHIGELVYGPLLRGASRLSFKQAEFIDAYLYKIGAVSVHCTAPLATITARLISRDGGLPDAKSGAKVEHAAAIRASFLHLLGRETGGPRRMVGMWQVRDMRAYPDAIALNIAALGYERSRPG